jgi:hypothetical protein
MFCSYALLNFFDQIVEVVGRYAFIAIARFWVSAAVVADDSIAGVALQPISRRGLNNSNEKRTVIKLTISDSQVSFKLSFFADWAYFRHFVSFLKNAGEPRGFSQ